MTEANKLLSKWRTSVHRLQSNAISIRIRVGVRIGAARARANFFNYAYEIRAIVAPKSLERAVTSQGNKYKMKWKKGNLKRNTSSRKISLTDVIIIAKNVKFPSTTLAILPLPLSPALSNIDIHRSTDTLTSA